MIKNFGLIFDQKTFGQNFFLSFFSELELEILKASSFNTLMVFLRRPCKTRFRAARVLFKHDKMLNSIEATELGILPRYCMEKIIFFVIRKFIFDPDQN